MAESPEKSKLAGLFCVFFTPNVSKSNTLPLVTFAIPLVTAGRKIKALGARILGWQEPYINTEGYQMNTKLIFAVATLILSTTASAQNSMDPLIKNILIESCTHAQNDDRLSLNKTLRANRLSKQNAVDKVVCNGKTLVNFARSANADKVVAMLEPYEQRSKGKVSISDIVAP
jgi:hypothetical protein